MEEKLTFNSAPKTPGKLNLQRTADFIASWEDFEPECYIDGWRKDPLTGKKIPTYSQGYAQRCSGGVITKERAMANLKQGILTIDSRITGDWSENQRIAINSFLYNHPWHQDKHIHNINNNPSKFFSELKWKAENYVWLDVLDEKTGKTFKQRQGGLMSRRQAEYKLSTT